MKYRSRVRHPIFSPLTYSLHLFIYLVATTNDFMRGNQFSYDNTSLFFIVTNTSWSNVRLNLAIAHVRVHKLVQILYTKYARICATIRARIPCTVGITYRDRPCSAYFVFFVCSLRLLLFVESNAPNRKVAKEICQLERFVIRTEVFTLRHTYSYDFQYTRPIRRMSSEKRRNFYSKSWEIVRDAFIGRNFSFSFSISFT